MVNLAREERTANFKNIQSGMATRNKGFSAHAGDVCTCTRITSRGVTQSNGKIAPVGREIASMHASGVTTARSWRGPGVENFAVNKDGHTVFSFDLFNSIPTRSDLFSWVNDLDTFVKDYNVGLEKTQVGSESADSTYEASGKHFNYSSVKDRLNYEASEKCDQNPARDERTGWAKLRRVVHAPSLPQLKVNIDSKQAGACS